MVIRKYYLHRWHLSKQEALDKICYEYNRILGNFEVEPLIAIPFFIHDFLCFHPFNNGNGRMSRLLTTLLLYRSGFYVGKYISLEAFIAQNKATYYETLRKATQQKLGRFTKQDILELCPSLSISSIEGALRKLIARGEIQREGIGRATKYKRL